MFLEKGGLKICSTFTGEHPCRSAISIKLQIALRHGYSPVNLPHIFRTPFPKNTSEWLLLNFIRITINSLNIFRTLFLWEHIQRAVSVINIFLPMKVGFRYDKRIIQKTVLSELNVIKEYWCPEKCPRKKNPEKIALGKMPSGQLPTEKLCY